MTKVQDHNETEYLAAVEEGKAIVADVSGKQWALGDLALNVEKKYGENRLERFAEDINFPGAACTLGRYRPVCLAFPKTGPRPTFFASAKVLQKHPHRICIVAETPDISAHEAREKMRKWRDEQKGTASPTAEADEADDDDLEEEADDVAATDTAPSATAEKADTEPAASAKGAKAKGTKKPISDEQVEFNETKRWVAQELARANDMIGAAQVRHKTYTPKERQNLVKALAMAPTTLATMEQANKEHAEEIDWLKELVAEAKEAAEAEGRIKRSPKRAASEPTQVSV
jgi:hypothetical protein